MRRGARRLTALGASTALAASALAVGFAAPASAEPVAITATVTDPVGNALDGSVTAYEVTEDGDYFAESQIVRSGIVRLGLEPGTYKFRFSAPGYATEFFTDKATIETADPVTITGPGNLGAVQLAPGAGITGVVTDEVGRPLPYVDVAAVTVTDNGGYTSTSLAGQGRTGKDGVFAFNAAPGDYAIRISGTDIGNKRYATEWFNNKNTVEESDRITHGGVTTSVGAIALSRGGLVRGRVTGTGDVALERVAVGVRPANCSGGCSTYVDYTDAAGNYAVEGLPVGDYKVEFYDPTTEYASEYYPDAEFDTAEVVTVGKDQVVDLWANLAASPAIDPATIDLTGRVVDSNGVPVIGATVEAYDTPSNRDNVSEIDTTVTNRGGYYAFTELDPQTSSVGEDTFKVQAYDFLPVEKGQFSRLSRWAGDAEDYDDAPAVTVPAGAAGSAGDLVLPLTGGISGQITSESSEPVFNGQVSFQVEEGQFGGSTGTEYDGTFAAYDLQPGKYQVLFSDNGVRLASDDVIAHVPEWFRDAISPVDAEIVEVKSGQVTPGINAALSTTLKAVEEPVIAGKQYLGKTVKARPGQWSLRTGTKFTYEWLVGDAVVGTGESIAISKGWKGKRLTLRVTAKNGSFTGVALVNTQQLGVQPKIKIKAGAVADIKVKAKKVKAKKIKGNVVVKEIVGTKKNGEDKLKKIGKSKVKNGKARVSLAKVKGKGKHKLVFTFKFKGNKIGDAEITKKVKRKR